MGCSGGLADELLVGLRERAEHHNRRSPGDVERDLIARQTHKLSLNYAAVKASERAGVNRQSECDNQTRQCEEMKHGFHKSMTEVGSSYFRVFSAGSVCNSHHHKMKSRPGRYATSPALKRQAFPILSVRRNPDRDEARPMRRSQD